MKGVVDVLVSHHLWVYILVVIVDQGDDCAFLDEGIAVMYARLNRNVISIRCTSITKRTLLFMFLSTVPRPSTAFRCFLKTTRSTRQSLIDKLKN